MGRRSWHVAQLRFWICSPGSGVSWAVCHVTAIAGRVATAISAIVAHARSPAILMSWSILSDETIRPSGPATRHRSDAIDRLQDIGEGIGVAEAQVTVAVLAECVARETGDAGIGQQQVRELLGRQFRPGG